MNMNACWVTMLAALLLQATYCDGKLLARLSASELASYVLL